MDLGASVEDVDPDPYRNPPLLQVGASVSTHSTFVLLRSRGAQLGPRTLYSAVGSEACTSSDPENSTIRTATCRYPTDKLRLDSIALDTGSKMPSHWGTLLCSAIYVQLNSEELVRFLLDRDADLLIGIAGECIVP